MAMAHRNRDSCSKQGRDWSSISSWILSARTSSESEALFKRTRTSADSCYAGRGETGDGQSPWKAPTLKIQPSESRPHLISPHLMRLLPICPVTKVMCGNLDTYWYRSEYPANHTSRFVRRFAVVPLIAPASAF